MGAMEKDWVKLGKAFKAAREWRGMTQEQVATAIGVDESTIQNLETARYGRGFVRMPGTAPSPLPSIGGRRGTSPPYWLAATRRTLPTARPKSRRPRRRI